MNGILLEDLSYQEVVTTLRESPQVAHLVLEKGNGYSNRPDVNDFHNNCGSLPRKTDLVSSEDEKLSMPVSSSECSMLDNKFETALRLSKTDDIVDSYTVSNEICADDKNSFSSLPTSIESSLYCAKECSSAPSSYQHNDYFMHNGKLSHPSADDTNINSGEKLNDSFVSSPPHAKDENRFQKSLSSYKSTPNLADSSDEEDNKNGSHLYRNRSTDCLLYSPHFMNPHQALFDLYQNYAYIRGKTSYISQALLLL